VSDLLLNKENSRNGGYLLFVFSNKKEGMTHAGREFVLERGWNMWNLGNFQSLMNLNQLYKQGYKWYFIGYTHY
jgi:hypothetical protein